MSNENPALDKYFIIRKGNKEIKKRFFGECYFQNNIKKGAIHRMIEEHRMARYIFKQIPKNKKIVVVCIGSEQIPGDMLGPCTGFLLNAATDQIKIYGNSYCPLDARTLNTFAVEIFSKHKDDFVIAIDASISDTSTPGSIIVSNKPIRPASAVQGCSGLAHIGNISIMGIMSDSYKKSKELPADYPIVRYMPGVIVNVLLLVLKMKRVSRLSICINPDRKPYFRK
jgi:putative sporulation protein YyaC